MVRQMFTVFISETALLMLTMGKDAQGILGSIGIGCVGFALSVVWGFASGRTMDRDTYALLGKMWGGLTLFGIILHFII
jgi:hypothetical protein